MSWFGVTRVRAAIDTTNAAIGRMKYTLKSRSCFFPASRKIDGARLGEHVSARS